MKVLQEGQLRRHVLHRQISELGDSGVEHHAQQQPCQQPQRVSRRLERKPEQQSRDQEEEQEQEQEQPEQQKSGCNAPSSTHRPGCFSSCLTLLFDASASPQTTIPINPTSRPTVEAPSRLMVRVVLKVSSACMNSHRTYIFPAHALPFSREDAKF